MRQTANGQAACKVGNYHCIRTCPRIMLTISFFVGVAHFTKIIENVEDSAWFDEVCELYIS